MRVGSSGRLRLRPRVELHTSSSKRLANCRNAVAILTVEGGLEGAATVHFMACPMNRKTTPSWLRALGVEGLPRTIEHGGEVYHLDFEFKHDFFAATARYVSEAGRAVIVKIGRRAGFLFLPLGWIGRLLSGHEARALQALDDIDVVPRYMGRVGAHGLMHEYIEGRNLRQVRHRVSDDFFNRLAEGIDEIHERDRAYVDLEKSENVIVGNDGKPYLCDFQISWGWPERLGGNTWPVRRLRAVFQQADRYHLRKLQSRARPDQLSPEELLERFPRSPWIRWHGRLTRPFTLVRRYVLGRLDPAFRTRRHEAGTIEHAEQLRTGS